jgi:hypothetical protein
VSAESRVLGILYWPGLALLFGVLCLQAQTQSLPATALLTAPSNGGFPVELLVASPAVTKTKLQVICLFHSDAGAALQGSLREIDDKLGGLLTQIRKGSLFAGDFGETLVIAPKQDTIPARRLLLIGLGDLGSFSPQREQLVGFIVFEESKRLAVDHPFFAPTVIDGGKTGTDTGEVAEQFVRGFLRAKASEDVLQGAQMSIGTKPSGLTFLAGAEHAAKTRAGLARASNAADGH